MASGNNLLILPAWSGIPTTTVGASFGTIAGASTPAAAHPVADFDDTTVEYLDFHGLWLPAHYAGGGVTLTFVWGAAATTNNGVWAAAFRAIPDDAEDLDTTAHTYDYNTTADLTPPSAIGEVAYDTLVFTDGADMDSVAASSYFSLRVKRPSPSGTWITGDQRLHLVIITET